MDLQIDSQCEQIIALYNPVASDLRFVLSSLSISNNLERMADLAKGIVWYVKDLDDPFDKETLEKIQLNLAFDTAMEMIDDVWNGLKENDPVRVRKVLNKDIVLDDINRAVTKVIVGVAKKHPKKIKDHLYLFSTNPKVSTKAL